ncbi:MAG TPA: AAA family ATPase [Burkholderiales bacterium]|nr:AAA family ATPase [Burkholderiales bacterium]
MNIDLKIEGLFGYFNYHLKFDKNINLITGPNGYGKTTVLSIIYAISQNNLVDLSKLEFNSINIITKDSKVLISKTKEKNILNFDINGEKSNLNVDNQIKKIREERNSILHIVEDDLWVNRATGKLFNDEELFKHFNHKKGSPDISIGFPTVYMVKAQRLISSFKKNRPSMDRFIDRANNKEVNEVNFNFKIEEYSKEIKDKFEELVMQYYKKGQELDRLFPKKLFDHKNKMAESQYNKKFENLVKKQKLLAKYNLSVRDDLEFPKFSEELSAVFAVYLSDTEDKLKVFDNLIEKLEIFTKILNEKNFVNKSISVNTVDGIVVTTNKNKKLPLKELSSGEQNEIVLMYELLFKTDRNTILLIDEPEISLHVVWQKSFIKDLKKIVDLNNITAIVATHSPNIINKSWELTQDLYKLSLEGN